MTLLRQTAFAALLSACAVEDLPLAEWQVPSTASPALQTLSPGEYPVLTHPLPVHIVFVGYEPGSSPWEIDETTFRSLLPAVSAPVVVTSFDWADGPVYYPLLSVFEYDVRYADPAFEDALFAYLSGIAEPQPLTQAQSRYNQQASRTITLPEANHWIEAGSVERWLADHADALGIDTRENTVFYLNWFGRPDFKVHVYVHRDEPDPDTGVMIGEGENRKLIAWGGTPLGDESRGTHRIWFHDLSAGPDDWTSNWDVDDLEVATHPPDGVEDFRAPPIWQYGGSGYRPFESVSYDLGLITRLVAINLLFAHAPLYPVQLPGPGAILPSEIQLDLNSFQLEAALDPGITVDLEGVLEMVGPLQPFNRFTGEEHAIAPGRRLREIYECVFSFESCYGDRIFRIALMDLVAWFTDHRFQYVEGDGDYELPIFHASVRDGVAFFSGIATDTLADRGHQNFVFTLTAPAHFAGGYGSSQVVAHEVGHHLGLSHPHDGFDFELGILTDPSHPYLSEVLFTGDESATSMSYMRMVFGFSQFDRDNMARYLFVHHLLLCNYVLGEILAHPRARDYTDVVRQADELATLAVALNADLELEDAASVSKQAARLLVDASDRLGLTAWRSAYQRSDERRPGLRRLVH